MEHNQKVTNGWQVEADVIQQPEDTVFDLLNCNILNEGSNSYAVTSIRGTKLSFTLTTQGYKPINLHSCIDFIGVISTNNGGAGGNGEIGIVTVDTLTGTGTYVPLYNHIDMKCTTLHQYSARFIRENPERKRFYFWDNYTACKVLDLANPVFQAYFAVGDLLLGDEYMVLAGTVTNLSGDYGPDEALGTVFTADGTELYSAPGIPVIAYVPLETIYLLPTIDLANLDFYKYLGSGSLYNGTWTYYYQIGDGNAFSPWSIGTKPIHITNTVPSDDVAYQNYQGMGFDGFFNTGKGIQLQATGIDTKFTIIRIAAVHTTSEDVTDPPILVAEATITGATMTFDHVDPSGLAFLTLEEIIGTRVSIYRNKCAAVSQNFFIMANVRLREEPNWDVSGATAKPIVKEMPSDATDYELARHPNETDSRLNTPLNGHAVITDPLVGVIYPEQEYRVDGPGGGSVTYNAVVRNVGDFFTGVTNVKVVSANVGPCTLMPVIRIQKYASVPATYQVYDIVDDYLDHKGMQASSILKSRWRGETYRIGVMLHDLIGNPKYVRHIKDQPMPEQYDTLDDSGNAIDATIIRDHTVIPGETCFNLASMGIEVSDLDFQGLADELGVALADLPKYFRGFSIVQAKRDATIMAQGIWFPVHHFAGQDSQPMNSIQAERDGLARIRTDNIYAFYSPDHLFNYNGLPNFVTGDKLKIVEYLNDDAMQVVNGGQSIGSRDTADLNNGGGIMMHNIYTKHLYKTAPDAELTPLGTENEIDPLYCREVLTGAVDVQITATVRFDNTGVTFYGESRGGKVSIIKTKSTEQIVADPLEFGYGAGYNFTADPSSVITKKALVNYRRPKAGVSLYGGSSAQAIANTEYYSCGHYQSFDVAFMTYLGLNAGIASGIQVYGGDCFIGIFDYKRMIGDYDSWAGGTEQTGQSIIFPCESNTNFNLRQGRHVSRDRSYEVVTNGNGVAYGSGTYDKPESLVYNPSYSTNHIPVIYPALPVNFQNNVVYEHTAYYSERKNDDQVLDNFRIFKISNFQNVNAILGAINALIVEKGKLFYIQEFGAGYFPINEKQSLPSTLGSALVIGTGGVMDRYDESQDYYGTRHMHSIFKTDEGFGFFDINKKEICWITSGNVNKVSTIKGLRPIIESINGPIRESDDPCSGSGVFGVYDNKKKLGIMVFKGLSDYVGGTVIPVPDLTISFDVLNKQFNGRYSFSPWTMLEHQGMLLSARHHIDFPAIVDVTDYLQYDFVQEGDALYTCLGDFTSGSPAVLPSLDGINWNKISDGNRVYVHDRDHICLIYGKVEDCSVSIVFNQERRQSKQIDNFESIHSRNFWDQVILENSWQSCQDSNINVVTNRQYEFRNRIWYFTAPQASTGKMTDIYCIVKFLKNNKLNGSSYESSNEMVKLLSLTTHFEIAE